MANTGYIFGITNNGNWIARLKNGTINIVLDNSAYSLYVLKEPVSFGMLRPENELIYAGYHKYITNNPNREVESIKSKSTLSPLEIECNSTKPVIDR